MALDCMHMRYWSGGSSSTQCFSCHRWNKPRDGARTTRRLLCRYFLYRWTSSPPQPLMSMSKPPDKTEEKIVFRSAGFNLIFWEVYFFLWKKETKFYFSVNPVQTRLKMVKRSLTFIPSRSVLITSSLHIYIFFLSLAPGINKDKTQIWTRGRIFVHFFMITNVFKKWPRIRRSAFHLSKCQQAEKG